MLVDVTSATCGLFTASAPPNKYLLHIPLEQKSVYVSSVARLFLSAEERQRQTSGMLAMATSEISFTLGFTLVITYALLVKESTGGKVILLLLSLMRSLLYVQSADLNIEDNLHHVLNQLMVKIVPRTCRIPVHMRGSEYHWSVL